MNKSTVFTLILLGLVIAVHTPYGEPDAIAIREGETIEATVDYGYHQPFYIQNSQSGYPQFTVEISEYMVADAYYGDPGIYEENVIYTSDRDPNNRCGESFSFTFFHDGTADSYLQVTGWNTEFGGTPSELYECAPQEEYYGLLYQYNIVLHYTDFYQCTSDSDCGDDHYCDYTDHRCTRLEGDEPLPPPDFPEDECTISADCTSGEVCQNGECITEDLVECTTDEDCTLERQCYDGVCGPRPIERDICCAPTMILGLAFLGIFLREK